VNKFSKLIVTLIILLNIAFTICVLMIFSHTASEPTTLIMAFFAFTTGELWILSSIKKQKIKKGDREHD